MSRPLVVLVGPPGAGKSTVGALVAADLGVELLDTDSVVESTAGTAVSEIFVERGEPAFRELERVAVAEAVANHDGVLALGGGAVGDPATRAVLVDVFVVHLDVDLGEAVRRVGLDGPRPLLLESPRQTMRRLLEVRRPLYEEVANVRVDTTGRVPADVAAEVARLVRDRT
jgi:shikimate kinase